MTTRAHALAAVAVAAALLVTGCTSSDDGPGPTEPVSVEPRVVPTGAEDRDAELMSQAVAGIDPCALLGDDADADGVSRSLFGCWLDGTVRITTYAPFGPGARYWQDPIELGGALAYRDSEILDWCTISLPVSFTHAITFEQEAYDQERDCSVPERYAAAAAQALLADPTALRRPDPRDAVIACEVFADIVGELPEGTSLQPRVYSEDSLDQCGVWEAPDEEFGFQPVEPLSGLELRVQSPLAEFSSSGGWEDQEQREVAGTSVMLWGGEDGGQCTAVLDAWTAGTPEKEGDVVAAWLSAASCDEAVTLAETAIPLLAETAGSEVTADAVVYTPDEPDSSAVGACVHAFNQAGRECAPAEDTEIPTDAATLVALGAVDPDVVCAAAAPAIADLFGEMSPVTVLSAQGGMFDTSTPALSCEFVRPDQTLAINVRTAVETLGSGDESTVAGHPAVAPSSVLDEHTATIRIGIGDAEADDGTAEPGLLEVRILALPDRTQGNWQGAEIDEAPLEQIDELAERLATDLLD